MKRHPQGVLRLTLREPADPRTTIHQLRERKFQRFNEPWTRPEDPPEPEPDTTDRQRELFGALLRRSIESAIEAVRNADARNLRIALDWLSAVRAIGQKAIAWEMVSPRDRQFSGRQLAFPLSLLDYVHAADSTLKSHRPPEWYGHDRSAFEAVSEKLDILTALVSRMPGAREAFAAMKGGDL